MTWLQVLAVGSIILNSVVFIVATKAVFRADQAEAASYIFMASFGALLSVTLWHLCYHTSQDTTALAAATALSFVSCFIFLWASRTIQKRPFTVIFSPDTPESLNQDGPYRYVRHPFYTSYLINFFAAALATNPFIVPAGVFLVILAIYLYAASAEEKKFAASALKDQYALYRAKTGMFMPRLVNRN